MEPTKVNSHHEGLEKLPWDPEYAVNRTHIWQQYHWHKPRYFDQASLWRCNPSVFDKWRQHSWGRATWPHYRSCHNRSWTLFFPYLLDPFGFDCIRNMQPKNSKYCGRPLHPLGGLCSTKDKNPSDRLCWGQCSQCTFSICHLTS